MNWLLIIWVAVAATACAEEDPSTNSAIFNPKTQTNNAEGTTGDVEIRNLRVDVYQQDSWDGCRAVTDEDGTCPVYDLTFALQNRSSDLAIDRITGATIDVNGGKPNVDMNFTCDKVPWFIEPDTSSNVIDMTFSYGGDDFSDPYVQFSCGLATNSPDSYEQELIEFDGLRLGPTGPLVGTLELRLDGLMGDASDWSSSSTVSF